MTLYGVQILDKNVKRKPGLQLGQCPSLGKEHNVVSAD